MPKYEIVLLDNSKLEVQTKAEVEFFHTAQGKYIAENTFTASSDERALDRLCIAETLQYRWNTQLTSGKDYDGNPLNHAETEAIRKNLKEGAITISNAHKELCLTKEQREKDKAESVQAYINNLLVRAKERGVHRENQVDLIINLFMEYDAHVQAFLRSDDYEKNRIGFPDADSLLKWWIEVGQPRFTDHDDAWRNSSQKFWRKEL